MMKTLSLAMALAASTATAQSSPADVPRVTEGLITAYIASELGDNCGDVNVRLLRGINYLQGLKNHLSDLGFSDADIDAYVDDRAEKNRLRAIAESRMASLGVKAGDEASYCAAARGQIAQETQIGLLLR